MKKNRVVLSICCILLVCVLLASFSACMKVGMTRNQIETKLKDEGATVAYLRTTPMTTDAPSGCKFEDLILSTKVYTVNVDGMDSEVEQQLYIIFCANDSTSEWALDACKKYVEQNKSENDKWNVYSYDRVVMCGYYQLLAVARGY